MSFTVIMVLLSAMGFWVLYQLLFVVPALKAKAAASGDANKKKPVLYWIIIAAQIVFVVVCLYRLLKSSFP
jgi:hypothetical protein